LTDADKAKPENVEKAFKKFCSQVKVDTKEHRLVKRDLFFTIRNNKSIVAFSVIISVH